MIRIHLLARTEGRDYVAACGLRGRALAVTSDEARVTCTKCLGDRDKHPPVIRRPSPALESTE